MDHFATTRTVTVAAGAFAVGDLGELTRLVSFEMVDDVLAAARARSDVSGCYRPGSVVHLLLAGRLYAYLGYRQVWAKLVAGLRGLPLGDPSASALRQARQRLGSTPLGALFDLLRSPAPTGAVAAVWWRGLLGSSSTAPPTAVPFRHPAPKVLTTRGPAASS